MKKLIVLLLTLFFVSSYSGNLTSKSDSLSQISALESSSSKIEESTAADIMQKLPLYFIENKGQIDERVQYQLKLSGMNVYFTSQEIVYQLFQREEEEVRVENIRMNFLGMNEEVEVEGREKSEAKVNYFIGDDPERWVRGARTYKKVIYRELYPDIDLIVYGRGKIKHEYRVRAGGEVGDIRIKYEGVKGLRVSEEGELEVILKGGQLREGVPISYQSIDGERVEVKSGYRVMEDNVIGFRVGEYEKDRELIIDPELSYSTYLGGSGYDYGRSIAIDGSGNVYVTGSTFSTDFPTTSGSYDTSLDVGPDAFITKLNSTGSELSYSTYLGGSDHEGIGGIAIDGSGNAYVTGYTESTDFPTTSGAYDTSYNGGQDVFITKLNSAGSDLSYSTYLGRSGNESVGGIAIDGSGNAYVTGYTFSTDFPTTSGAYDRSYNGGWDAFITKLNSTGSELSYSTYLGGSDHEGIGGIAIDGSGNAYVTGDTYSTDFPTASGAYDTSYNGGKDVFITKLNSTGSELSYSTYLGGSDNEFPSGGIVIDGSGNVYVTGHTTSSNFPTTSGAYNINFNGYYDVFITKLNSTGADLSYSTYLGGNDYDRGTGIAIDESGNAYITGYTLSTDFPTTSGAYDTSYNGISDVFITKLNSAGSDLYYSTYLGGSVDDWSYGGIAIDGSGNVYVTGYTESSDFPTTSGAYDISLNGSNDVFITKLLLPPEPFNYISPLNAEIDVPLDVDLDWEDSVGADCYDVYFGTTTPPPKIEDCIPISSYDPGLLIPGTTYYWQIVAKNANNETSGPEWNFITKITPEPDIKANGSDGPITISRSDTLSITVEFDAGPYAGEDADWWLVAKTPLGWYYYHPTSGWLPGRAVTLQMPLRNLQSREVFNMSGLPAGIYKFYFAVDMVMNGSIDVGQAYYDKVKVTINP